MADPSTDKAAAEAFTSSHGFTKGRYGAPWSAKITWGPDDMPSKGKPQCRCKIWGTWDYGQCTKVGKVTLADGSTWCGIHAPAAVAKRDAAKAARQAEYRRQSAASSAAWKEQKSRAVAFPLMLAALRAIRDGDNDPRVTARAALEGYESDSVG